MPDLNTMIDNILAMPDMDDSDKVYMFIQLCDDRKLTDELRRQGMMQKIGIMPESLMHNFVYGVLRIAKPYLFPEATKEGEQHVD